MYRYIALLDQAHGQNDRGHIDAVFRSIGLQLKAALGSIDLYAADDTPVLRVGSSAALIGHTFLRYENRLLASADVAGFSRDKRIEHILHECWGEYLLLLAPGDETETTTVMRDPSGGVDCIYSENGAFVTSDVSIAAQAGLYSKAVDWEFIENILLYPHLKTGRIGLASLRELLPGCLLDMHGDKITIRETWSPWDFVQPQRRHHDPRSAQAGVRRAVVSTVKRWAETDKSLLLELSGGLDSSILAACLQDANTRVACCNLITPVPGADERRYARLVADMLGVKLHVETLNLEHARFDFAPPPHAVVPGTWVLQYASNELKETIAKSLEINSFFSGGGGDTVFCYTRTAAPAVDAFKEHGIAAGIRAVHDLAELHQCTIWKAGRLAIRKFFARPKASRTAERSFLADTCRQDMLEPHPWFRVPDGALPGDRERIFDLAGTQVFKDGLARGAKWRLRMPLLSQPVVEACLQVPSWMWIAGGRNRAVARDAFADILPNEVLYRRSKGTFTNYSGAVFRRNKHQLQEYLLSGQLQAHGFLDTDALRQFFDQNTVPRSESFMRIFDICAVENWLQHQH